MKTIIRRLSICSLILSFVACNENEIFEKEIYKNIVYVLSDDNQVLGVEHDLNEDESIGYVSIGYGGSRPISKDIYVEIEADKDLLSEYNKLQHDTATLKFAKELGFSRYNIPEMFTTLKVGNPNPYSLIPIKVNPHGLSPDSAYMISLKIKSVSGDFGMNESKNNLLYRVFIKNDYAQQKVTSYYKMRGIKEYTSDESVERKEPTTADKIFSPIDKNVVRFLSGNVAYKDKSGATLDEIQEWGILAEIQKDNSVILKPAGSIQIEMLGNAEDNSYEYDELTGSQTFHFHYKYYGTIKKSDGKEYSTWITMTETCIRF